MQDASQGWLAIRFGSCGDDLVRNFGAIGVGRFSGQCHAMKIRELTERILLQFCCPTAKMPDSDHKRKLNLIYSESGSYDVFLQDLLTALGLYRLYAQDSLSEDEANSPESHPCGDC